VVNYIWKNCTCPQAYSTVDTKEKTTLHTDYWPFSEQRIGQNDLVRGKETLTH